MLICNITTHVDHSINEAWVKWMQETHIPEAMKTGCFTKNQFVKILDTDETEGVTYAVQYYAESKAAYNRYITLYATQLRNSAIAKWGNKIIAFNSTMQVVH